MVDLQRGSLPCMAFNTTILRQRILVLPLQEHHPCIENVPSAHGKCNINKGYKTVAERAKADFNQKWEEVLNKLQPNDPDNNFCLIEQFSSNEIKKGIHQRLQTEIQGILANMIGRNTENRLADLYELILGKRKGLLLNGFKMRENLKLFFDAFKIKLPEYQVKGKSKEREEVEHDILHMAPNKDKTTC